MAAQQPTLPLNGLAQDPTVHYRGDHLLVAEMVERGSKVLDVGCGEGDLLQLLETRGIDGRGIELSREGVNHCVAKGLAVVQGDADADLVNYPDDAFDYVILSQTLQATRQPRVVLENLLRIGHRAIVSFPNFGFWKMRLQLLIGGHMPRTENLPATWYDTANIHFCTIKDFVELSATRSTSRWSARSRSISTAVRCGSICPGGSGTCSANRACFCSPGRGRDDNLFVMVGPCAGAFQSAHPIMGRASYQCCRCAAMSMAPARTKTISRSGQSEPRYSRLIC